MTCTNSPSLKPFMYWSGKVSDTLTENLAQWSAQGIDVTLVSNEMVMPLLKQHCPQFAPLFQRLTLPACQSDIARLVYLYEHGGIYLDSHIALLDPHKFTKIYERLTERDLLLVHVLDRGTADAPRVYCNGVIAAKPRSPVVKAWLEQATEALRVHELTEAHAGFKPYNIFKLSGILALAKAFGGTQIGYDGDLLERLGGKAVEATPPDLGIRLYAFYQYRKTGQHWSERQKQHPLFLPVSPVRVAASQQRGTAMGGGLAKTAFDRFHNALLEGAAHSVEKALEATRADLAKHADTPELIEMLAFLYFAAGRHAELETWLRGIDRSDFRPDRVGPSTVRYLVRALCLESRFAEVRTFLADRGLRHVTLIGLQRSGTNYVSALIEANTQAIVYGSDDLSLVWKHALPDEAIGFPRFPHPRIAAETLREMGSLPVLVTKKPELWLQSILKQPKDFFARRPGCGNIAHPDIAALAAFHVRFTREWSQYVTVQGRGVLVSYETVIRSPELALEGVSLALGEMVSNSIAIPDRVPESENFTASDRQRYMTGESALPASVLSRFRAALVELDPSVRADPVPAGSTAAVMKPHTAQAPAKTAFLGEGYYRVEFEQTQVDGQTYFVPGYAKDRPASQAILAGKFYEPRTHALVEFILDQLRPGDIVHAGTFFGDMLPSFARKCPGTVYAFEPVLENYVLAKQCVMANHLDNVALFNSGLSDAFAIKHVEALTPQGRHKGGASALSEQGMGQQVTTVTIDSLGLDQVSVIELDIEGHELPALRGALKTLVRCRPIVMIEDNRKACAEFLTETGYRLVGTIPGLAIWCHRDYRGETEAIQTFLRT